MRFEGLVNGVPSSLEVSGDRATWSADIDVGGYRYQLIGQLVGNRLSGTLIDTVASTQTPATGTVSDDVVRIDSPVQLLFRRVDLPVGAHDGGDDGAGAAPGIDSRIVGVWLWSEAMASDGLAVVSQQRTHLGADGTFAQYDAQTVGSGFDPMTGIGGAVIAAGQWRADGNVLALSAGAGFVPTATYQTDGASLLLSFADGSQQLWRRQQ
jgi:hypothetical protein